jgi:uncharacterized protein (TIGR02147 family)
MEMASSESVYDYKHYKPYLLSKVGPKNTRLGIRGAMARALKCQSTYISQVLYGRAQLSLEQGELLSEFLGHSRDENHYFLLLIQRDRAGTKRLEKYFTDQIEDIIARRLVLTERLGSKNQLTKEAQSIYYSSWHYSAVHVALTVPELRTAKALSQFFRISLKRIKDVLDFLSNSGLANKVGDEYQVGDVQIRLGNSSHNIIKHHTNWRNQAIESLDREQPTDLHYSGVVSLSKKDVIKIKNQILEFIKETIDTIRKSEEEAVYSYCIDFFDLQKSQ